MAVYDLYSVADPGLC